jgi:hypothetical protein
MPFSLGNPLTVLVFHLVGKSEVEGLDFRPTGLCSQGGPTKCGTSRRRVAHRESIAEVSASLIWRRLAKRGKEIGAETPALPRVWLDQGGPRHAGRPSKRRGTF